jgi:Flp pilus assembly protein TadG
MRYRLAPARSGVAAVEFAVLLPFLMALFLFATDFARILYYTITIENVAHNGTLLAHPHRCTE